MHTESLTALALLLAAAVAMGLFMSRLRLPAAAGFILVALALGPSGWGLIDPSPMIEDHGRSGRLDAAVSSSVWNCGCSLSASCCRWPWAWTLITILLIASTVALFTVSCAWRSAGRHCDRIPALHLIHRRGDEDDE